MNARSVRGIGDILSVTGILHACGKDMAKRYDIHHWDNPWPKTLIIVLLCLTKNKVKVVEEDGICATFQTRITGRAMYVEKLAVKPEESGKGIGSRCLSLIEKEAKENGCEKVWMEVYAKSRHAIRFYTRHGYSQTGEDKTLKYDVVRLEKVLE